MGHGYSVVLARYYRYFEGPSVDWEDDEVPDAVP